jgi:hypothetical protein
MTRVAQAPEPVAVYGLQKVAALPALDRRDTFALPLALHDLFTLGAISLKARLWLARLPSSARDAEAEGVGNRLALYLSLLAGD